MLSRLFWVPTPTPTPGRLVVLGRPRPGDWLEDEVANWRAEGIETVVCLLERNEAGELGLETEGDRCRQKGLEFLTLPIADRGVPSPSRDAGELVERIAADVRSGRNVGVHCRAGIGRSGMIAAGVLIRLGSSPDEALRLVAAARGVPVPDTAEQEAWVRALPTP